MNKEYIKPCLTIKMAGTKHFVLDVDLIGLSQGSNTNGGAKERYIVDDTPSNSDFGTDNLWGDLQD